MNTQPETLLLAIRALDAAVAGVRAAELNERTQRRMTMQTERSKIEELERDLREAAALNRALQERLTLQKTAADKLCQELRERIAKLEFDEVKLRDRAASLAVELNKRELAIVDLVLKGCC